MSRKNHVRVDGKLLQTNKRYSNLKMKQQEKIAGWFYSEIEKVCDQTGRAPSPREGDEIVEAVLRKIEEAQIWIPPGEIYAYYSRKKSHFLKRYERTKNAQNVAPAEAADTKNMNAIVIFNPEQTHVLFCKRQKAPYQDRYNFVGGKIKEGETGIEAAYRELEEETGITEQEVELYHLMDFTYTFWDFRLEIYAGTLSREVVLREEKNPLLWLPKEQDYWNTTLFAGDGNIEHIMRCIALREQELGAAGIK